MQSSIVHCSIELPGDGKHTAIGAGGDAAAADAGGDGGQGGL